MCVCVCAFVYTLEFVLLMIYLLLVKEALLLLMVNMEKIKNNCHFVRIAQVCTVPCRCLAAGPWRRDGRVLEATRSGEVTVVCGRVHSAVVTCVCASKHRGL